MRVQKLIALFMIYLIISLTFATAFVFATIYKAEAFGQDEVPGIIRSEDNLVISTESVLPVSVAISGNASFMQMNCDTIATPMSCAYTRSINNVTGKITATVKESGSGDTKTVEAYVDNKPPVINTFSTSSTGNRAQASYTIVDQASTSYPSTCSGIKKVELYLNNQMVNSTSYDVGDCNANGVLTGSLSNFVGKVNTSIIVYDYMDFSANKTGAQVFIDTVAPKIMTSADIYYAGTESEIKKVSTKSSREIKADVVVEVEDDAIAPSNSVFGDFSSFDRTSPSSQNNIAASCQRQGWNKTYTCTFSNIKLMPADANLDFIVTVTDQVGNTANQSLSVRFDVVNDAGEVIKIEPKGTKCSGSTCYMKGGLAEVTAEISTQSSYNNSEVKINGAQTKCTPSSGKWLCAVNMSVSSAAFSLIGYDDLGNSISGQSTGTYILDSTAPQLMGEINTTPVCPTASESLVIEFNVTDAQSPEVTAWANTLAISDNNETRAKCTQIEGYWNCVLTVGALKSRGITTNLQVGAEDFVGNKMTSSVPVQICVNVDEVPDLIEKIKTRGTLPKIDRKTASKITLEVPIGLEIVKKSDDVEILERSMVDCSATACINGQAYLVNELTLKPMMILPLKYTSSCGDDWDEEDLVKVNCTQEFSIKHGLKIYTQREVEQISTKLEVYNQPLGGIDKNFKRKTTEIKKQIIALDKQIEKYDKVYKVLGTVCKFVEGLGKINALLQTLKSALWGVCLTINAIIPGLGDTMWTPIHTALSGYQQFVDTTIWPQGWVPTGGNTIGLLVKGTCSIYTCKFYDFNTFVDIAISIAAYEATKNDKRITDRKCDSKECITNYEDGSIEQVNKKTGEREVLDGKTGEISVYDKNNKLIRGVTADGQGYDVLKNGEIVIHPPESRDFNNIPLASDTLGNNMPIATDSDSAEAAAEASLPESIDTSKSSGTGSSKKPQYLTPSNEEYITMIDDGDNRIVRAPTSFKDLGNGKYQATFKDGSTTTLKYDATKKEYNILSRTPPPNSAYQKTLSMLKRVGKTAGKDFIHGYNPIKKTYYIRTGPGSVVRFGSNGNDIVMNSFLNFLNSIPSSKSQSGGWWSDFRKKDGSTVEVIASDSITGNAILDKNTMNKLFKPFTPENYQTFDMNVRIGNAMDAFMGDDGSWIYNPYKSKHYDGLCAPAILFNDRKERQLLCKRLGCLEEMAKIGGPLEACEFEYNLDMCMYVESARYKIDGAATIGKIFKSVGRVFLSNILGLATTVTYLFVIPGCVHYQIPGGMALDYGGTLKGARAVACGLIGTLMSMREMIDFAKNPYNPLKSTAPVELPASSPDFCAGVDYSV